MIPTTETTEEINAAEQLADKNLPEPPEISAPPAETDEPNAEEKKALRALDAEHRRLANVETGLREYQKDLIVGRHYQIVTKKGDNTVFAGALVAKKTGNILIDSGNGRQDFAFKDVDVFEVSREKAFEISTLLQ